MIGLGTLVNTVTVVIGGALGGLVIPQVPENVRKATMQALGLGTLLIGLKMAWETNEILLVLISLAVGTIVGELARIEDRLEGMAAKLERLPMARRDGFAKAFVQTSLLFCVGAMAITGSLQDGLQRDPSTLYAKAILDGVASMMFGSVMGPGVMLSAIPVFLYQGAMTLGASALSQVLTTGMINEVAATGGLLVVGISLNLLGIAAVKVGNMLPALLIVAVLVGLGL